MAVIYSSLYLFSLPSLAIHCRKNVSRLILSILLLFSLLPASAQTYVFARLDGAPMNTTGWSLNGEAAVRNVIFNNNSELLLCSAKRNTSGGIFFNQPINLSMCSKWRAEFDFRMNGGTGADGIAFSFLDAPPSGFVIGQGLGLPAGVNGLKVCFDTYNNCISPSSSRVPKIEIRWGAGYNECWSQPTKENTGNQLSFIRSNSYNRAVISYDNGNITVSVNGTVYLTGFQQFNFSGYLGFTASTGAATDNHSIRNAIIYTEMPPSEAGNSITAPCNIINGQIGTTPTAGYSYTWTPSTGLSNPAIANPVLQLTNTSGAVLQQKYYVKTAFTSNPGCYSMDSIVVQLNPLPAVALALPVTAVCSNAVPFSITGGSPAGGIYTGPGITGSTFTPSIAGAGSHVITYSFTNASGCSNAATQTIVVNALQPVIARTDVTICAGSSIPLTATNASSYQWSPNVNLSSTTGSSVMASPISTTTYTVNALDNKNCASSDQVVVTVVQPTAASIRYIGNPFCGNQSIPVVLSGQTGGTFSAPAGLSIHPGTGLIQLAGSTPGTYSVTYTFSNGVCTDFTQTQITILPPPAVSFNNILPAVCFEGAPFSLTGGMPAGGIYSGPGVTGGTFDPAVAGRGIHVITYSYSNVGGCVNSATNSITVYPITSVNAGPPLAICSGGSIALSATNADSYTWSPNYMLSSTTGAMVTASPLTTTTYIVTGLDNASGCTSQASVTVSVLSAPTATIGYAGSPFCRQGNALVSLSGQTGGMFSSDAGLSIDPSSGTIDLANSTPGNYTITYAFTNGGCSGITSTTITLLPPPSVSLMPLGTVCFTSLPFSLTGGMPLGGQFAGAGISGGIFDPAVAGKGIHTITYTVIDGGGCMATASQTILVSPLTPVSAIADLSTCIGSMVTLTATDAVTYQWMPGSLSGSVVTIVPVTTTTYTVTGIHADGCSSQDQVTVLVRPLPHAAIEYPGTPFCNMGTATVSRIGQAGGTYSSTAGLILDAATGAIDLAASTPGIYTVTYTFSDGTCTGVTTTSIEISTPPAVTLHLPSATVCNNAVAFTLTGGMPVGGIYSGTSVAGNQFDPTTAGRGQHLITYTYTTAAGCSSSATEILTVHPLIDVNAGSDISVCVGNTVILSASNAVSYAWTPNSSLSAATGQEVVASPLTTTLYRVTGTDAQGCTSHDDVWVFVQPLPTASIQYPSNIYCNSGQASVIRTGVAGGSYSADVGLIMDAITGEIDLSASTPGSYTVTYSFSNGSCSNESSTGITILAPPSVRLVLPVSSSCVNGAAITLSGGLPAGGSYGGVGVSAGVFTPAVAGNGVHVITYVYTDAGGCTASATASFTVNPLVNVQAGADLTICLGATATLTAIHAVSYSWSPGTTLSSTSGSSVVASPLTTTGYTVTGMDVNGCSSSDVILVTVLALPTASISYVGNPFCQSGRAQVNRVGQAGGT
ncbi:MAG: lectin-like domain-containing protein, partial [Bacteroidota bacterium]